MVCNSTALRVHILWSMSQQRCDDGPPCNACQFLILLSDLSFQFINQNWTVTILHQSDVIFSCLSSEDTEKDMTSLLMHSYSILYPGIAPGGRWWDTSPHQHENLHFLYSRFVWRMSFRMRDYYIPLTTIASYLSTKIFFSAPVYDLYYPVHNVLKW